MEEKGLGYLADILVFALLISTAITILSTMSPVDPRTESERYASSLAQGVLLSFQHLTADRLGGFEYSLGALGFELDIPVVGGSARRDMGRKTVAQLIAEDALLNLRVEVVGKDFVSLQPSKSMDDGLRRLLKSALDNIFAGKFAYRLRASANPIDLEFVKLHFEIEIANMLGARTQLCSESLVLSLPASNEELSQLLRNSFGVDIVQIQETDSIVDVSLELWSL